MNKIEELAKELKEVWFRSFRHGKERWIVLSHHVQALVIQARIDEGEEHLYDSTMAKDRNKELTRQLEELRDK